MCNRHGVEPPVCTGSFREYEDWVNEGAHELQTWISHFRKDYEFDWIGKWTKAKQEAIKSSVRDDQILPDRVKNMVKRECGHGFPKKARCIQFYKNLATQAKFAPEFTALQKAVGRWCYDRAVRSPPSVVTVTCASGMNAKEIGEWMAWAMGRRKEPRFYERDGKNWDATMQEPHQSNKELVYALSSEELKQFARDCAVVKGGGSFNGEPLLYTLQYTTKSGHNDTTLGNNLNNAAVTMCAMKELGIVGDILVAGDDLIVVIEGDFSAGQLAAVEATYGIKPEARGFSNVLDVTFISGCWFPNRDGYFFSPKPGRLMRRLFWTTKPPPAKHRSAYLNGVCRGLRMTCGDMPVVGVLLTSTIDDKCRYEWRMHQDNHKLEVYGAVEQLFDDVSFEAFLLKYRLTHQEVLDCEEFLLRTTGLTGIIAHNVLSKIELVDLAELEDRPTVGRD